jgi:hypothetical protein
MRHAAMDEGEPLTLRGVGADGLPDELLEDRAADGDELGDSLLELDVDRHGHDLARLRRLRAKSADLRVRHRPVTG